MNVWLYIFIVSIPIIIGIFFLISFFTIKDKDYGKFPRVLGLFTCIPDSITSFIILLILMIFTVIVLQLLAYGDLYDKTEVCMPILYYFGGNKDGCKQVVARHANIQSQLYDINKKINEIKNYKPSTVTNNSSKGLLSTGIFEDFVGGRRSELWSFSHFANKFDIAYKTVLKEIILYVIKFYRDILLPWTNK